MTPSLRLPFAFAVVTLFYPGLAILGLGGFAAFLSHPALIALAIVTCLLSGAWLLSSRNLSPGEREDRTNRWVLVVFGLIGLLDAYLPAYTDRTGFWTMDGVAIRWLGVALFAGGGVLRIWPVFCARPSSRRWSSALARKKGCCARSPVTDTKPISAARRGRSPDFY
jgi:hypothetical protein